jgi:hypothetical protein
MKGMPIRNGYYVLAQQLSGEIIRAPNTTKKFNELLFVFFIGKRKVFQSGGFFVFSVVTISFRSIDFMEFSRYMSVRKIISDFLTTISKVGYYLSHRHVSRKLHKVDGTKTDCYY